MKFDVHQLDAEMLRDLVWAEARRRYLAGEAGTAVCADMGLSVATFRARARRDGWRLCDRLTADEARGRQGWRASAMRETSLSLDQTAGAAPETAEPLTEAEAKALEAEAAAFSRKAAKLVRAGRLEAGEAALREAERRRRIVRRLQAWAELDADRRLRVEEMSDGALAAYLRGEVLGVAGAGGSVEGGAEEV
ncbi:MAG: hypothetical protein AAFX03_05495 [Pseudomonadota bacterium]